MNSKCKKCWIKSHTITKLKIASAIGKMKQSGINIISPDINDSSYTFSPDVKTNSIRYGLSGITRIGEDIIKKIIENRPYTSLEDFIDRVKLNKPQMVNLIKSGAFDCFGDRQEIMSNYIESISDLKKRVTMQNFNMLIDFGLVDEEYQLESKVYKFTKYIKKFKFEDCYLLDNIAFEFYSNNFDMDKLIACSEAESGFKIKQTTWEVIYKKHMANVKPWVKDNADYLLESMNNILLQQMWEKYCLGTISKWEMDSISCYIHEHELLGVDSVKYEFSNFFDLAAEPEVERIVNIKGKIVPMYKLRRIIGTVLDRDKTKKTVTLLTTDGVVTVKIYGGVFQEYDKRISEKGADGVKHVIEQSAFSRGNKIIITGIRDGEAFLAKKYRNTPFHRVEIVDEIKEDGTLVTRTRGEE